MQKQLVSCPIPGRSLEAREKFARRALQIESDYLKGLKKPSGKQGWTTISLRYSK